MMLRNWRDKMSYLYANSALIGSILLFFALLMLSSIAYGQEVDIVVEPEPQPEQEGNEQAVWERVEHPTLPADDTSSLNNVTDTPLGAAGEEPIVGDAAVGLAVDRDSKRLDIMAFQTLSYESTGEYTQIKGSKVVEGDLIGFDASLKGEIAPTEEIHVYDAPCGQGWQLLVHDMEVQNVLSSTTKQYFQMEVPIVRSYGYGCEHDSRTFNW